MAAEASDLRRSAYLLLTAAAVAVAAAKVVGAENVHEPSRYKAADPKDYGSEPDRKWPQSDSIALRTLLMMSSERSACSNCALLMPKFCAMKSS